jgi:hypothetical protein
MKPFGTVARKRLGIATVEPKPDAGTAPADAAWMVLEAANDLGDHATVEACRRVIDAGLNGRTASPSDVQVVLGYFA